MGIAGRGIEIGVAGGIEVVGLGPGAAAVVAGEFGAITVQDYRKPPGIRGDREQLHIGSAQCFQSLADVGGLLWRGT
ncbi:hypothetical protein GCM10010080_14930 [Thermomonas carbonis]|nr:hypothetical protein GCM10010080_14930 [Thermomonas carbonis]